VLSIVEPVTANVGDSDESVLHDSTDATLNNIEKSKEPHNFQSSYYIQFKKSVLDSVQTILTTARFDYDDDYKIEGDFGWRYVPNNIEQAADILIEDLMSGDSEFRRHAVTKVEMDVTRYDFRESFYETTGNIDADVLLMDYTLFVMDYVV